MKLKWAEELRCQNAVYNRRWYFECSWFSLRLHHWLHSDDSRAFHDHPFNFWTFVLKGSYEDITPEGVELMPAGTLCYRKAEHRHWVKILPDGCWTILLTGPKIRKWGFWTGNTRWRKSNKYFYKRGPHVCD